MSNLDMGNVILKVETDGSHPSNFFTDEILEEIVGNPELTSINRSKTVQVFKIVVPFEGRRHLDVVKPLLRNPHVVRVMDLTTFTAENRERELRPFRNQ